MHDKFAKSILSYHLSQNPFQTQQGNKKLLIYFQLKIGTSRFVFYDGWIDIFFPSFA